MRPYTPTRPPIVRSHEKRPPGPPPASPRGRDHRAYRARSSANTTTASEPHPHPDGPWAAKLTRRRRCAPYCFTFSQKRSLPAQAEAAEETVEEEEAELDAASSCSTSHRDTVLQVESAANLPLASTWFAETGKDRLTSTFSGRCLNTCGLLPVLVIANAGKSPTTGTKAWAPSAQREVKSKVYSFHMDAEFSHPMCWAIATERNFCSGMCARSERAHALLKLCARPPSAFAIFPHEAFPIGNHRELTGVAQ
jgi:hypothetical protein